MAPPAPLLSPSTHCRAPTQTYTIQTMANPVPSPPHPAGPQPKPTPYKSWLPMLPYYPPPHPAGPQPQPTPYKSWLPLLFFPYPGHNPSLQDANHDSPSPTPLPPSPPTSSRVFCYFIWPIPPVDIAASPEAWRHFRSASSHSVPTRSGLFCRLDDALFTPSVELSSRGRALIDSKCLGTETIQEEGVWFLRVEGTGITRKPV